MEKEKRIENIIKKVVVENEKEAKLSAEQKEIPVNTFTIFFKTEFSDLRLARVFWYLIGIVILGIISSAIVSLIF